MNKKVALSVLSTAVVASMAASAYAAPQAGVYVGGDVKKFYSTTTLLNLTKEAKAQYAKDLRVGSDNLVFVHINGKGAFFSEIIKDGSATAFAQPLKKSDFVDLYKVVKPDGTSTETEDARAKVDGDNTGELKVESVSAINASQIEVKFAAPVEKKSAETPENYKLESYAGTIVPTLVNDKTVVLTLEADKVASLQQESKTLSVDNIKSAADTSKKVSAYSGKVSFLDLSLPQAISAKLVAPGKVQVTFNEPVYVAGGTGFMIDGGQYSVVVDGAPDFAAKTITLATGSLSLGEHTITVNPDGSKSVKDGAGLLVAKTDVKFTVSADTTAPVLVSATATSQFDVVLTFDEPITGIAANKIYHTANTDAYQAKADATEVPGSGKKQWKVSFKNPLPTGTVTINLAKEAVQDNFNNKNASVLSTNVSIVSDTVKPTVTELKVVSGTRLTLTFSEDVVGADSKANYKITDSTGAAVSGYNVKYDSTDKKATVDFTSALKEGKTYSIEITGIKDHAVVPNEIDKYTNSFTVSDTTPPSVTENGLYDLANSKITIFFSEAMNGTQLLDKSKYTLSAKGTQVALPADAQVVIGPNNSSVSITLPSAVYDSQGNDIKKDIDFVIVGQLTDLANNKTAKVFTNVKVNNPAGKIDTVANSAITVDKNTVKFTVNKPLKSVAAADFIVGVNNVEFAKYENQTLKDGTYGSVVTLQVKEAFATDAKPVIKTKNAELSTISLYGDTFAKDTTLATAIDGLAPEFKDVNRDNAVNAKDLELKKDAKGNVASVIVSFTEALKPSTVSLEDFEVPGYTVGDVKLVDETKVEIVLGTAAEQGTSFKVRFVGSVSDKESNAYAGNGFEFTVGAEENPVNNAPTVASPITDTTATVGTDKTVDLSTTFADKDNDKLTLTAKSSDEAKATVTVSGTNIVVKPLVAGETTITVTAEDGKGGKVDTTFKVTVSDPTPANQAPVAKAGIDQSKAASDPAFELSASDLATDADAGDTLTIIGTPTSSDDTKAAVALKDGKLEITPKAAGETTIKVDVTDGKDPVTVTFNVTIS
ncbi:Ig-like domain-containing protein [Brevibacillus brevis]|uniref:Ig-like domain-containing protein n=1 Tax=Brevibacillus brevis TaxID=1393 RepID=UPI001ED9D510|nr:Ig-like domain-containing protein [Brevibacillus brevis]UKL00732.1 hypothetical protein FO446_26435 [Brevibacillus brevis]